VRHADLLEFLGTHTHTEAKSSYNRYRAVLRGLFRFAVEAEYIAKNPADELVFRKQPQKSPKALTDQEYTAIFQHLPEYAQIIVQILVDTGIRRSQLFRLEWGDVDTINRTLKIRNPKDGEMSLPILKKTADLLDSLRPGRTFKRAIGKNFTLIEWPDDRDSSACVVPEIDIKKSLYKASAMARLGKDRRVTIHMMRHTWATRLRRAGVALDRIQELGGWDSYEMVLRYADVPDDLRNAMDRLDQFSSGNNTDPKLTVVSQG
jgi:integrase